MGTTSSHHGPYGWGNTRATMVCYSERQYREVEQIYKTYLSSDCSLQLDYMKSELLVTACQQQRREYVHGSCTHRPSHHGSCFYPKSLTQPLGERGAEGEGDNWDEVVTR